MASVHRLSVITIAMVFCFVAVRCEENEINPKAVEEGRTLVHHAMKRLSLLLPAFMFKLGIMFTMILVSMITSTKGLLVGTLLLALGIGHFIASKFSATAPASAHITLPHYPHAHIHALPQFLDRSDNIPAGSNHAVGTYPAGSYPATYAQSQAYGAWKH